MSRLTLNFLLMTAVLVTVMYLPAAAQSPAGATQDNPFFGPFNTPYDTPAFNRIQIGHYLPAVQEGVKQQQAEIDAIVNNAQPATFQNTVEALDRSGQFLSRVNGVFFELLAALTGPDMEAAAKQITPLLSAHNDNIILNEKLFARVKAIYDQRATLKLTGEQLYLLETTYRGFVRGGALLDEKQKTRLRDINQNDALSELKYGDNVLKETNDSYIVIDNKADLAGLPEGVIAIGEETAKSMNMPGKWVYTTQRPSWTPFLQYSSNRKLREALYTAYFMRGDRDNDLDTKALLQKIISLRDERCKMLGYPTPAHFYLDDRMAKTPDTVNTFLMRLWKPALDRAKNERAEMQAIIGRENGGFKLASWDWLYYAEKLRKEKYDLDDSVLRPYFQLENVRKGIFTLAGKLYGVTFTERKDIPIFHPDVTVYEVKEADGRLLGILYMDCYPRDSKRGGAWSGGFRSASYQDGKRVIPFATMICNLTKPTADAPSLLSIDEVSTLFHEFGHALNSLFANGAYRGYNVPQDAVELPSQIMENWTLEPEMLKLYATHYKTGEVIPAALVEKLKNSSLFNQGFETVEYLAACFLDMDWHTLDSALDHNVTLFEEKAMNDINLIPEILPRYRSTYFTHIMGGYPAGYYSYIWAGVLDADAFEAFKETSLFDHKTADSFRKNILEKLGTEDAMTLYKRFRGREPKVEPLLKKRGLLSDTAKTSS